MKIKIKKMKKNKLLLLDMIILLLIFLTSISIGESLPIPIIFKIVIPVFCYFGMVCGGELRDYLYLYFDKYLFGFIITHVFIYVVVPIQFFFFNDSIHHKIECDKKIELVRERKEVEIDSIFRDYCLKESIIALEKNKKLLKESDSLFTRYVILDSISKGK